MRGSIAYFVFIFGLFFIQTLYGDSSETYSLPCQRSGASIAGEPKCSVLKEFLKSNLKTEVSGIIEDYYLGRERISSDGTYQFHKVPVCNFFQGEGFLDEWSKSSSKCHYNIDTKLGKDSCPTPPSYSETSKVNFNDFLSNSNLPKSFKFCGSFCEMHFSKCKSPNPVGAIIGSVFSWGDIDPADYVTVEETGHCQREYSWQRGLYPQALWKHTENIMQEIDSGRIDLAKLGSSYPCSAIKNKLLETWAIVDRADALFAQRQLEGLEKQSDREVSHCKEFDWQFRADSNDNDIDIKKINEALLESGFSQTVCSIKAAKFTATKLIINLAKCEAVTRAQNQWIDARSKFSDLVIELESNVEDICQKSADHKGMTVICKEDVLNACYRRELHKQIQKKYLTGVDSEKWRTTTPAPVKKIRNPKSFRDLESTLEIQPAVIANKVRNQINREIAKIQNRGKK